MDLFAGGCAGTLRKVRCSAAKILGTGEGDRFQSLTLCCLLLSTLGLWFYFSNSEIAEQQALYDRDARAHVDRLHNSLGHLTGKEDPERNRREDFRKSIIEARMKDYSASVETLATNLKFQAILIVLAFLLALGSSDHLTIPVIGTPIPSQWLHILIPMLLVYLWMQYGFVLNDLILTRISIVNLMGFPNQQATETHPVLEDAHKLLRDRGVVDLFCVLYRKDYGLYSQKELHPGVAKFLLFAVYGLLLGSTHGCALGLLCNFGRRYANGGGVRTAFALVIGLALLIFAGTHWLFYGPGLHPNDFQLAIAFFAIVSTFLISRMGAHFGGPKPRTDLMWSLR